MSKRKLSRWVSRMLSEGNGTPSTKRVCFLLAIVSCVGLCAGLYLRHGMEALAVDLAKTMVITAGSAYGITRFAEYGMPAAAPPEPAPPTRVS